jgi:tetratricopeptide (TPR) repeat protein
MLALVVPLSAQGLGSLLPSMLIAVALTAALACALLWFDPSPQLSRPSRYMLWGMAVLVGATIIQATPLPATAVHFLAPTSARIWERALSPLHEASPGWQTLSVAPAATRVEVVRGLFYIAVFLGAVRVASGAGGTTFLERLVIISCVVMAFVALTHAAVDAKQVFGIYRPREIYAYLPGRYGPLLNVNHLAAYLDVGACVSLGTLLRDRPALPRPLALGAALLLAGTSVWAGSRGGTGALVLGAAITVGLSILSRRKNGRIRTEVALPVVIALAAAGMLGLGLSDFARDDLANTDTSKVHVALSALRLVPEAPWFGLGRGAFEGVFPSVRHALEYTTFTHPENIIVQWTTEWGVPVALAGVLVFGWALRPHTVLTAARPVIGAWAGVVACVVHDLVDFHLEVPGVVALVVVCVALVVGARVPTSTTSASAPARSRPIIAWTAVLAIVPAALWMLPDANHMLAEDRARISAAAVSKEMSASTFRDELRAAMLRYPAEAFFPLMGAVRAQVAGEETVIAWVARALEMNPRFGRAHLVLARSLRARHRAQARLEYRLAYENDVSMRESALKESPALVDNADDALELVPAGRDGIEVLDSLAASLHDRLPSTAAMLDAELVARDPGAPGALRRQVAGSLSDVKYAHVWCTPRDVCVRDATAAARALVARQGQTCEAHLLLAKVRIATGDTAAALDDLEAAIPSLTDRFECRRSLIRLAVDSGQPGRAEAALERLVRAGCGDSAECGELYAWAGSMEDGLGKSGRAIVFYRRALEVTPRDDLVQRIAELAAQSGRLAEAIEAYEMMARRFPNDPRWAARATELRAQLGQQRLPMRAPLVP